MKEKMPELFRELLELGCIGEHDIHTADDGFCAVGRSLADILACRGITTFPGGSGEQLQCSLFFDDWFFYAVPADERFVCGLFKMREQEYDAQLGLEADGDIPGVTVSFIEMKSEPLMDCLTDPVGGDRGRLSDEINRVAARGGQTHCPALKTYFIRTEAQGGYLIARMYTDYIASLAADGTLPVPECYASEFHKRSGRGRVSRFIERNNSEAGTVVCDHVQLRIADPRHPTVYERLAILATHTGNESFFSFAAEIQFHARFLAGWARIPIPFVGGTPYASAIRADMSIGDAEFAGPTPYYRDNSRLLRAQRACHEERLVRQNIWT